MISARSAFTRETVFVRMIHQYYSAGPLLEDVHAGRMAFAFTRRPVARLLQASPRSPGSRAWSFQTCMGSAITQGRPATRSNAAGRVAFRIGQQRRHPGCTFSKLNTLPIFPLFTLQPDTSQRPAQNSGPSGSLLPSRKALHHRLHTGLSRRSAQLLSFFMRTVNHGRFAGRSSIFAIRGGFIVARVYLCSELGDTES